MNMIIFYTFFGYILYLEQIALTSPKVLLKDIHIPSSLKKTLTSLNYFMIGALYPLDTYF